MAQTEWTGTVRRPLSAVPRQSSWELADAPVVDVRVRFPFDGVCVLDVKGDIDMLTAPVLDSMIARQIEARPELLILDLRGVDFMSSAGLASLMAARDASRETDIRFRLVCTGQPVLRPMTVTGLTSVFDIHADLDAALA